MVPVDVERLVRNRSFMAPSRSRASGPSPERGAHRSGPEVTWEVVRGRTQRAASHPWSCSAKRQRRECQREREGLYRTWLGWWQAVVSHAHEKLLAVWIGGVGGKPESDLVVQWVCNRKTF